MSAFPALEPDQRNSALLVSISTQSGMSWAHRGDFNVARSYLNQAYHNFANLGPPAIPFSKLERNQSRQRHCFLRLLRRVPGMAPEGSGVSAQGQWRGFSGQE